MNTKERPVKICSRHTAVEVAGSTGNRYTVRFVGTDTTCTCLGYHHRENCRHLAVCQDLRCTWTSLDELAQQIPGSCPRCGAAIETPVISAPASAGAAGTQAAVTVTVTVAA